MTTLYTAEQLRKADTERLAPVTKDDVIKHLLAEYARLMSQIETLTALVERLQGEINAMKGEP